MVLYIFLVAALNLSVGFTVAVYLGRQYRDLLALAEASAGQAAPSAEAASAPAASRLSADPTEEISLVNEALGLVESEVEDRPGDEAPSDDLPEPQPQIGPGDRAESWQEPDTAEGDCPATGARQEEPGEDSPGAARKGQRLDSAGEVERDERSKGSSGESGLAASLEEWREEDPRGTRQLNAAMIDIDGFAKLNDRLGRDACDRILRAITGLLEAESHGHTLEARFSGQRFLLLFPDVDLRFTINVVERIRQTVEKACFVCENEEIKVTASCAVGELAPEDTPDTLHTRVEATLFQAKRYKGNRTFVNEGKYPTPVVPPTLDIEERSVRI